jgi:16S rRNA (guanine1516-N2)-methyltransferase
VFASCAVAPSDKTLLEPAQKLAGRLELAVTTLGNANTDFLLVLTPERLELHKPGENTKGLYVDFSDFVFRQGKEPITKAIGLKGSYKPRVLDCTAGLGQDAFVLAAQGSEVTLLERSSLIHALLNDGLARALQNPQLAEITSRMTLHHQDAQGYLETLKEMPDVIYLDPMYPESGKAAAKRKSMRFFRDLVGDDLDAERVIKKALSLEVKRVVVKRPLKAPPLANLKPQGTIKGKTTRFDIY